jgi:hypothetical protein
MGFAGSIVVALVQFPICNHNARSAACATDRPVPGGYLQLRFRHAYRLQPCGGGLLCHCNTSVKTKRNPPATEKTQRPSFIGALRDYPKSVKEGIYVWRKVPKSAFNLFLAIIIVNGLVVSCQTYFVVYATSILKISLG